MFWKTPDRDLITLHRVSGSDDANKLTSPRFDDDNYSGMRTMSGMMCEVWVIWILQFIFGREHGLVGPVCAI